MTRRNEEFSNRLLRLGLGAILAVTCAKVWIGPVKIASTAQAQIPDAGAQRDQVVQGIRKSNELLAQIVQTLKTQTLKVEVQGTDKTGVGRSRTRAGRRP